MGNVLDVSYPAGNCLTFEMLDTQQIRQIMSAVHEIIGQRCEELEETVFLRSEMKTHGEAPVVEMVVQNADESILEPQMDRVPDDLSHKGGSPPRGLDIAPFSIRGAIAL